MHGGIAAGAVPVEQCLRVVNLSNRAAEFRGAWSGRAESARKAGELGYRADGAFDGIPGGWNCDHKNECVQGVQVDNSFCLGKNAAVASVS